MSVKKELQTVNICDAFMDLDKRADEFANWLRTIHDLLIEQGATEEQVNAAYVLWRQAEAIKNAAYTGAEFATKLEGKMKE